MSTIRWLVVLSVLTCASGHGVSDGAGQTPLGDPAPAGSNATPGRTFRPDGQHIDLATAAPGYGGFYWDGQARAYFVHSAIEENDSAVVAALRSYLSRLPFNYGSDIRVLRGKYDFRQLLEWKDAIAWSATDLYSAIGVDGRTNRLVIGIPDESRRENLMSLVDSLGIPESAVHVMTFVVLPFQ
jgi:hypothetical protein